MATSKRTRQKFRENLADPRHGKAAGYFLGCHCSACDQAGSEYFAKRRRLRTIKQAQSAERAELRLQELGRKIEEAEKARRRYRPNNREAVQQRREELRKILEEK